MEQCEYIRLSLNIITEEILEQYNLRAIEKNWHAYKNIILYQWNGPGNYVV